MGLAPGGVMHQEIYEDEHEFEKRGISENLIGAFVTIANANQWMEITGGKFPQSTFIPLANIPKRVSLGSEYYGGDKGAIDGAKNLENLCP